MSRRMAYLPDGTTYEYDVDDGDDGLLDRSEAFTDAVQRRRPIPGEGYLWVVLHRLRGHRVDRAGWSISHRGARRAWYCGTCRRTWP